MTAVLLAALGFGVLSGVALVARGGPENSLIGLNAATICAVTALAYMDKYVGVAFSDDIAFYLVFPGVFGVILFTRFLSEVHR